MTSLRYKIFEYILRKQDYRGGMKRDMVKQRHRHTVPTGRLAKRYSCSEFDEQAVWRVDPKSGPSDNIYVHYHGGGYVYGLLSVHFPTFRELADKSGVSIIIPDYPLPPSSAADIHGWSLRHFESLIAAKGIRAVSIGGCSAGANLALAVLQLRQRAGKKSPSNCILWSPWVNLARDANTKPNGDKDVLISMDTIAAAAKNFAGDRSLKDPLISPLFANLEDMPDLHIFTGGKDVLYPDTEDFAKRAKAGGRLKTYKVETDYGHYWMFYPTPERHKTIYQTAKILRRSFESPD